MCTSSPAPPLLLSCRKVPGVGKVTQKVLARFGVHTGADLLEHRGLLEVRGCKERLGHKLGQAWQELAAGCLQCGLPAGCMHATTRPLPAGFCPPSLACSSCLSPLQALFSQISVDWFARVALGLGETRHPPPPAEGEVGRKGISHERTFRQAEPEVANGCLCRARAACPCSSNCPDLLEKLHGVVHP